jgi:hypothetical protein
MGFCIAWIMENKIIQCIKVFSHIFFKSCVFVKKWFDRLDTVPVFRSKNTDVIGWVIWRYHIIQTMHVETCLLVKHTFFYPLWAKWKYSNCNWGRQDHMVVGFICNQCLSPMSSNPAQARCTRYNIMW